MKIQFLNGGLANQVFQYLFTRYYSLSHNGDIMYLDDSYFALNTVHNGYELERVFSLHPPMLSDCLDDDVWDFCLQNRLTGKSIPQIMNEIGIPFYDIIKVSTEKGEFFVELSGDKTRFE